MKSPLISAVIFDFNGTLFFDTEFHNQAWKSFSARYAKELGTQEMEHHVHGCTNREILGYIFKRELSNEEILEYSLEKEAGYREICLQNPDKCILTPGAEYFLEKLKRLNIPRIIATASNAENLEFFIRMFDLGRWFDTDQIVFDTGEYRGKPFPDMFLAAAGRLHVPINECLVVEDSLGGVHAAKNAGAARIVAISNDDNPGKFSQLDFIDQIITDFRQLEF